jgi:phosphoglycerate dehydrogenase-like enzyme
VPFNELDNFVLSPHRGGMVEEVEEQRIPALAALINAANRGEPIPNKVDLKEGY